LQLHAGVVAHKTLTKAYLALTSGRHQTSCPTLALLGNRCVRQCRLWVDAIEKVATNKDETHITNFFNEIAPFEASRQSF